MDRNKLEEMALGLGADFFGVADLEPFCKYPTEPAGLLDPYKRAISMAVALSNGVIEGIVDCPTPLYSHHYARVNDLLDHIALRISGAIQKSGGRSLPIPASQIMDRSNWMGAISHKAVARMAGIGWQGKSLLLVNPKVGPRLRLVTVLTDLDLVADQPMPNRCGKCEECVKACPAGAITGKPFGEGYADRSEAWSASACTDKLLNDFAKKDGITPLICGICVRACPFGKAGKKY